MSNDTPTERFEQPDAPTEVMPPSPGLPADGAPDAGLPPAGPPSGDAVTGAADGKSKRTIVILLSILGALLLAVLITLILLLTRGAAPVPVTSPTPTASSPSPTPTVSNPTPTPTPTPTPDPPPPPPPDPPPPPPPPSPISAFTASDTTVDCGGSSSVPVTFSWAAVGETLWFGVGTDNAKNEPFSEFPLNYTFDFNYQCGQPGNQQKYTITVEASDGTVKSKTVIIKED